MVAGSATYKQIKATYPLPLREWGSYAQIIKYHPKSNTKPDLWCRTWAINPKCWYLSILETRLNSDDLLFQLSVFTSQSSSLTHSEQWASCGQRWSSLPRFWRHSGRWPGCRSLSGPGPVREPHPDQRTSASEHWARPFRSKTGRKDITGRSTLDSLNTHVHTVHTLTLNQVRVPVGFPPVEKQMRRTMVPEGRGSSWGGASSHIFWGGSVVKGWTRVWNLGDLFRVFYLIFADSHLANCFQSSI